MTTTTAMESVSAREHRLADLRSELEAERVRLAEAEQQLADAYLSSANNVDELSQAVSQSKAKISGMEKAFPRLEEQIATEREAAFKGEADKRMVAITRAYGSAIASYRQDEDRLKKAAAEYASAMERINERYVTLVKLKREELFLVDRFGVQSVGLAALSAPIELESVREGQGMVGASYPAAIYRLPPTLLDMAEHEAIDLRHHLTDTPTGDLLKAAGETPPGDTRTFEQRRNAAMDARRTHADREYRESIAKVDEWLREQLASGPVKKQNVMSAARAAGIAISGGEATISSAKQRVGVLAVTREDEPSTTYWTLPDNVPEDFRVYRDSLHRESLSELRW